MRGLTPFAPPRTLPFARLRTFGLAVVSSVELPRSGLAKPLRTPPSLLAHTFPILSDLLHYIYFKKT